MLYCCNRPATENLRCFDDGFEKVEGLEGWKEEKESWRSAKNGRSSRLLYGNRKERTELVGSKRCDVGEAGRIQMNEAEEYS